MDAEHQVEDENHERTRGRTSENGIGVEDPLVQVLGKLVQAEEVQSERAFVSGHACESEDQEAPMSADVCR